MSGYSVGEIELNAGKTLYINVGGQGRTASGTDTLTLLNNGNEYNGGGIGSTIASNGVYGGGGGATHIATRSGLLSTLSAYQDDILIVAGGGGGAASHNSTPNYCGNGGNAGGQIGLKGVHDGSMYGAIGSGGTQTEGGICTASTYTCPTGYDAGFGKGGGFLQYQTGTYAGGGGGYYGGSLGYYAPGAGGSGYIGNSKLISTKEIQKSMYSSKYLNYDDAGIKTLYTSASNTSAIANTLKSGNGYARITFIES